MNNAGFFIGCHEDDMEWHSVDHSSDRSLKYHLVVSQLSGWYDLCTKKASRWSCWIYLAWEVAVVMPISRWSTQIGKLKTSASWKTPCVARLVFLLFFFSNLGEALVLGKWMSQKWNKHIYTIIHMWPMYTNVAFTYTYHWLYWLFDAQNSSKHWSGGLKVARTHLVAPWQSQCFSQQALAMKHWISDKQAVIACHSQTKKKKREASWRKYQGLGTVFVFPCFQAFGKACRIILKFAKHTHIDGYSTFLATGLHQWCGTQTERETVLPLVKHGEFGNPEAKEHCWYQPDIDFFVSELQDYFGWQPATRWRVFVESELIQTKNNARAAVRRLNSRENILFRYGPTVEGEI